MHCYVAVEYLAKMYAMIHARNFLQIEAMSSYKTRIQDLCRMVEINLTHYALTKEQLNNVSFRNLT